MADAAADPNRASNRPTAKKSSKITTAHPPQTLDRKTTRDALQLPAGADPKLGRSVGDGMLPDTVTLVEMIEKKYKIAKETGSGTFGKTFKAINIEDGQLFCVKTIPKANFAGAKNDQYDAEIFKWCPKRNSTLSMEARNPNVCNIFKAFHDADNLHLVMPECSGGDLFDKCAAGKLPAGQANKFVAQIVGGLGYIAGKNIAHRDIRPENYMLTTSAAGANLMLIDFAMAKLCENDVKMVTMVGTPTFVAPEVLLGPYDKKCDVYSAGVLAFLLTTGRFALCESDPQVQLTKAKAGDLDWTALSEVIGQMPGLLKDMLNKDPFTRPSAVDLASRQWLNELGGSGGCCSVQ